MNVLWYELSFREPLWLWLAVQPWLIMLLARLIHARKASQYSEAHLLPWVISQSTTGSRRRYLRTGFMLLAWAGLAMAIAGPRLPESVLDTRDSAQREVMIVLDVSPSMSARDILPNRLERAKLELLDLIDRMQATRMGIVVYGARPHLLSPLTHDKQVLRHYISTIKTGMLPTQGSRLKLALHYAVAQFSGQNTSPRALLIISDGEYHINNAQQKTDLETDIQKLKQQGTQVYALGIGTRYGAPLLASDNGWLEYEGQTVNSQLQAEQLQQLTRLGNGIYSEVNDGNLDWQKLYDEGIGRLRPFKQSQQAELIIWQELYHWCLLASLACFILALWQPRANKALNSLAIAGILLVSSGLTNDTFAASTDYKTAYANLQSENYPLARQQFAILSGYAARLGEGTAAYRMQDYKLAAQQFTQAMLDAGSDKQRGRALFNLANCKYQLEDYVTAARLYRDVLNYLPGHGGAKTNLAYAVALQEEQLQGSRPAHRAGTGPQTGRLMDGQDITSGKLTLGDEDETKTFIPPDITTANKQVMKQGLLDAQPASRRVDAQQDQEWDYRISRLEQLQQANLPMTRDEGRFWQRLYELEEGFMAPVETTHPLPGVKPW